MQSKAPNKRNITYICGMMPEPMLARVDPRKEQEPPQSDKTSDLQDKPHSPKAAKKKGKLERLRDALAKANATNSQKTARTEKQVSTPDRDKRIPDSEWKAITRAAKGPKRCHYYNSSMSCSIGDKCRFKHTCMQCGEAHPMVGDH